MKYTDTQLKQALAKMLPETLLWDDESAQHNTDRPQNEAWGLCWDSGNPVLDTELLHLCWLVEETLTINQKNDLFDDLIKMCGEGNARFVYHATWQQRVIALCKVKGVEIV